VVTIYYSISRGFAHFFWGQFAISERPIGDNTTQSIQKWGKYILEKPQTQKNKELTNKRNASLSENLIYQGKFDIIR